MRAGPRSIRGRRVCGDPGDPEGEGDDQRDALHPTHRNLAVFELCCAEIDKARDDLRVMS